MHVADAGRALATKLQLAYLPPSLVEKLRCQDCDHFADNENRCMLIQKQEGPVDSDDCCNKWWNAKILTDLYGPVLTMRPRMTGSPDLGRQFTKAEVLFTHDVQDSIVGCADCVLFAIPDTCTVIGEGAVEADGACASWRNPTKEANDRRFHAEHKTPSLQVDTVRAKS